VAASAAIASNATFYVYDEQGHLLGEYDAAGRPIQETVYLGDLPVAVLKPGPQGTVVYYVYADHLNTPRAITATNNSLVWRWDNGDPFGAAAPDQNPAGMGIFEYNLRFPGQIADRETYLVHNGARDYDAMGGRYMQSDPIGLAGGINTYSYALNNPIRYTDPTGLDVFLCSQPAFGISSNPIDHQWIKTDSIEAGMGGTRGNVPGNDSGDLPGDRVQVTDHSGRNKQPGASCQKVDNVDENKVNAQLKLARVLGRWGPTNQCQSFARGVIDNARTTPPNLAPFNNPALWGF
jgi:RHS repeat-associated protein